MQSGHKRFRPHWGGLLLGLSVVLSPSVTAADEPMKLACKYESASLSDSGKDKGYALDCRNITDDRCPPQQLVLDGRWKVQGDESILNTSVTSGLGQTTTQTTTVNRATLRFTFRWEMASKERPPPILMGEGSCVVQK